LLNTHHKENKQELLSEIKKKSAIEGNWEPLPETKEGTMTCLKLFEVL
jgi:hypothetical protein